MPAMVWPSFHWLSLPRKQHSCGQRAAAIPLQRPLCHLLSCSSGSWRSPCRRRPLAPDSISAGAPADSAAAEPLGPCAAKQP